MKIRFSSVANVLETELLLSLLEFHAFARGEAFFSDIDIDWDAVMEDAADDPGKFGIESEKEVFDEEPTAARQLLEELLADSIFQLVDQRCKALGSNYAFVRGPGSTSSLVLRPISEVSAAGLASAWLSFFQVIDDDNCLNLEKKARRALRMAYAKVFELVALIAATSIGPSIGWWTGRSWSNESKFNNFDKLCEIVGYGNVKPIEMWEETQKQAKDAGTDAFLVTTLGGRVSGASIAISLGATVQEGQRQKKKLGKDERDRLLAFFLHRPTIALVGAAADPYPKKDSLAQDYARADCLYLHNSVLWELLSLYKPADGTGHYGALLTQIESDMKTELAAAFSGTSALFGKETIDLHSSIQAYLAA